MVEKLGNSVRRSLILAAVVGCILPAFLCSCSPRSAEPSPREVSAQFDETNPLGANAACYVCHMTFVKEELSKTHLRAAVTCVRCHGVSAAHANDEDIGATPPDIILGRDQVEAMCLKCHQSGDISDKCVIDGDDATVCTDCHGSHRIAKSASEESGG